MKKYIAPEVEKVEYEVVDCLDASASTTIGTESENADGLLGGL